MQNLHDVKFPILLGPSSKAPTFLLLGWFMFTDTKNHYGALTRFLHWLMAVGFLWMFFTAVVRSIDRDSALNQAIWPYHSQVGFTILLLAVVRIIWALRQSGRRPTNDFLVRCGHIALYVLMVLTPTLALLRQYGSGRSFNYFGWQLMSASDEKVQGLIDLGNQWHSVFGWVLFTLIFGHIVMAFYHRSKGPEHDVLPRIWGRS